MTWLRCTGCDEIIEVPDELVGDAEVSAEGEILNDGSWFYLCDACEDLGDADYYNEDYPEDYEDNNGQE